MDQMTKTESKTKNLWKTVVGVIFAKAAELVYPPDIYCLACGKPMDPGHVYSLCEDCLNEITWADRKTCLESETADIPGEFNDPFIIIQGFGMECNDVRACFGKNIGEIERIRYHQMHVFDKRRHFAESFQNIGTECQVRHEMPVHDIEVKPFGTALIEFLYLLVHVAVIQRQY